MTDSISIAKQMQMGRNITMTIKFQVPLAFVSANGNSSWSKKAISIHLQKASTVTVPWPELNHDLCCSVH